MRCSDCSECIYPVVALDIDGTLGQYHEHFKTFMALYLDTPMPANPWGGIGDFEDYLGVTKAVYREAKLAYRQGGWKRWMPIYPGAVELINRLHDLDVEVWLVTTRPWMRLDNIDPDTREWCRRNGIEFDGMLFGQNKYEQLVTRIDCNRIVAVLEDENTQVMQAQYWGLPVLQRVNGYNNDALAAGFQDIYELWEASKVISDTVDHWKELNGWHR